MLPGALGWALASEPRAAADIGLQHFARSSRGNDAWFHIWATYAGHDDLNLVNGTSVSDQWSNTLVGFRYDHQMHASALLSVMGDAHAHPVAFAFGH